MACARGSRRNERGCQGCPSDKWLGIIPASRTGRHPTSNIRLWFPSSSPRRNGGRPSRGFTLTISLNDRSSLFSFRLNGRPVASIYRPIQKEFCLTSRTDFIQTSLEREKCVFQVSESDNRFLRCRDLGFIAGVIQRGSIHTYTALRYKNYCAIIKVKEFIKFMRLLCRSAMRIRTLLITDTIFLD